MGLDSQMDFACFVDLIDNAYDEIFIWDHECRVVYANKACSQNYGYPPEFFLGKTLEECWNKEKYWDPTTIPYILKEKKPVIQRQKTILGLEVVTIAVPVFDSNNNIKYIVQNTRNDDDFLYRKLSPIERLASSTASVLPYLCNDTTTKKILDCVETVAQVKAPILILGETGTGKSLLAKHIHQISPRKDKPFVSINMASIPPSVLEAEFFGYKKGAFTGADEKGKKGFFELANGGTLFLDEIGEIPVSLQAKFLHAIQEEEILPIGGAQTVKLDVRIISATNCDLGIMVEAGKFRGDLYHRLNVFEMTIPPLRERPQDLSLMAYHFLNVYNYKYSKAMRISDEVMEAFRNYDWKGNIRELSNVIERSILLAKGNEIEVKDLPGSFFKVENRFYQGETGIGCQTFHEMMDDHEGKIIRQTYAQFGSTRAVARALHVSQSTAHRLVQKHVPKEDLKHEAPGHNLTME